MNKLVILLIVVLSAFSCGDDWPKAIDIGVSVGGDAGAVCLDIETEMQVACPDGGTD